MPIPTQLNDIGSNAELDEGRLIIEVFDANGICVERSAGPGNAELKEAHDAGECGAWCAHCYTELEHGAVSNVEPTGAARHEKE